MLIPSFGKEGEGEVAQYVQLFATPWTVARQAPKSMEFSRQEYWSELPFPSPGYLCNPRIETVSLAWQSDFLTMSHLGSPLTHYFL